MTVVSYLFEAGYYFAFLSKYWGKIYFFPNPKLVFRIFFVEGKFKSNRALASSIGFNLGNLSAFEKEI